MTGKREMIPQNDLGSPGGKHAALILWMVTELLDRGIRRTSPNELNSAGYLFQEWLGIPTQFSFPMISGAPRNGNLEHLVTGIMFNAKVMDERAEPQSRVMLPGWHASRVLEKHRDFLAQHEPELNLTAGIMDRLEPRERADMNGLIWMILRNPDHGLRDLERSMVGTWGNLRGDPHERFRNACANLRTAWEMARDRGLEPTAEVPSHRENLIQENPDQGPETCRTHGEPYGLESQGHRFHLVKLNGIYWCCWDHTTTLTGASIGPAPAARTPWDTGCPKQWAGNKGEQNIMSDPNDVPCETFQMVRAPQCTHCGDHPETNAPCCGKPGYHGYLEGCDCPECNARYREEFPEQFQD